ncbi:hypothetical protein EA658_15820 [Pseudoxanthomonas winnipegensis]|jgi:hypothetical protein|uniref:Uncharacterized protein n=1 Tax=Pseudoxanthomonas winnipegensis TaxID=2480810 RepID=A0ABY1WC50_9GAMM|nr:hypothetical protein [Pseudoxanthomonas winnipegensis]TAA11139.1 hypothetical protein EA659_07230 [Pseudoxanthomonas winnipegensis]TAA18564.1 hypothetical protein EA658_15820 [Pseudoxanthomonas winnipegensis]TAH74060.1 hypothetical protein EA657_00925 [Pseudoxanthomonas winnipegensis]
MKHVASTALIVLSTLLLGFYALILLLAPAKAFDGSDSRVVLVHAIGLAGLALAVMAVRELRRQRHEALRLRQDSEGFV